MNILLYGGTFNPPHLGHVSAAVTAGNILKPDKLIWMPSPNPPHKELDNLTPSSEHRLEMTRLAALSVEKSIVSDLEMVKGLRYTYDTARALKEIYPCSDITILVGSDMLKTLKCWNNAERLLKEFRFAALTRDGAVIEPLFGAVILPHTPYVISSTRLRKLLGSGRGKEFLPEAVYNYIWKNGLYGIR